MENKFKRLFTSLTIAILFVVNSVASSVKLTFTGATTDNRYCLLDSVRIENLTLNTVQTLDCLQDTTFELNISQMPTSLEGYEPVIEGCGLISSCPTFLYGSSFFTINPLCSGIVKIRVFDMLGRVMTEYSEYLEAGHHQFTVNLSSLQFFILSVTTKNESEAVRLMNIGESGPCSVNRILSMPYGGNRQYVRRSDANVQAGYQMRYTGYTNQRGNAVASHQQTQYQNADEDITLLFDPVNRSTEGMYVSMVGFNNKLYSYPFDILTTSNLQTHTQFVSNLSMDGGTISAHAVYTSLDNIIHSAVPKKLENVSLVTFTDGLDGNSWRMNSNFTNTAQYLAAVSNKIQRVYIDGIKLDAYAIGVKGSDVNDLERFDWELNQLASDPSKVYNVSDMDEVNARFREIAAKIYNTKVAYSLTIKLPAPDPGSLVRFTFDNVSDVNKSIYYIEGRYEYDFEQKRGYLKDVVYCGLKCDNGSTWTSVPNGIFDMFTIKNLSTNLGERVSTANMREWYVAYTGQWQVNSEFDSSSNTTTTEERTSAIVALVLDCSSSLGSSFSKMQTAANNFLRVLAGMGELAKPSVSQPTFTLGDLSATLKASVTNSGNLNILDKGFCVSEHQNMDDAVFYSAGVGTSNFQYKLSNLIEGKKYYVRPYATNQLGTSYGAQASFTAIAFTVPTLTTASITDITINSATFGGNVTFDGYSSVTERGVCWSISPNPTVEDNVLALGSGSGSFSGTVENLQDGMTYYVRAYAKNVKGIGYGDEQSFTTIAIVTPTLTTNAVTDITINSATFGGSVTFDGYSLVTERGVCWSTSPNPTVEDNVLPLGSGSGSFSGTVENLQDGTTYYVRAYAKNVKGIGYGDEQSFTTIAIVPPTLTTNAVTDITINSATFGGSITFDGYSSVTERGVCWSTSPNPTVEDNVLPLGSGSGSFSGTIENLQDGTTYYVRAYAKNVKGIGYGDEQSFTTIAIVTPTLTTNAVTDITINSAKCGGSVTFDGYSSVTERGVCWSTSPNPTVEDNVLPLGSGSGSFSGTVENLQDGTTYYIRAYAKNVKGIGYGDEQFFTTIEIINPQVTLSSVVIKSVNSANCNGIVTSDGNAPIIERGFCWSKSPNPTIEDNVIVAGTGIGDFSGIITDIEPNTKYYVRAFAKNSKKIGYSQEASSHNLYVFIISYTANQKLSEVTEVTSTSSSGLRTDAFNLPISAHEYKNGNGYLVFSGEVTHIGYSAFEGCTGLTSITIPNSVTSIGMAAFAGCTGLTSIIIPNSVTSIGNYAFSGCTGLSSITIGNSVTSIGARAFFNCTGLTSVKVEAGNKKYDSRDNCNAIIETSTNKLLLGCKSTIIPISVTSIGNNAFDGCTGLTSITIPNSVTSIGSWAFADCTGLTSIEIPNSVKSIGDFAFSGCTGLTSIAIPNNITSIGQSVFSGCESLTSVTIPDSVTSIGISAFGGCTGLTSITIPNSVTSIGSGAFTACSGLSSIVIPNRVKSIENNTFKNCVGLTSITIPNSVTSIGQSVFSGCTSLKSITIGNSVTSIGARAFFNCTGLKSMTCYASTPPACGSDPFYNVSASIPLYVPAASINKYESSMVWKRFTNIKAISN